MGRLVFHVEPAYTLTTTPRVNPGGYGATDATQRFEASEREQIRVARAQTDDPH